ARVADHVRVQRIGRFHRDQTEKLQQVVLDHVAQRPGFFIIAGPGANSLGFAHGDLNVIDILMIPDRLEDAVCKPDNQEILNRLLAQVMIDAEDLRFVEDLRYRFVDLPRGVQVPADRLSDDDPREGFVIADRLGKSRLPQTFYREDDCRRGNGEIKDAVSRQGELGLNVAEARAQIQVRLRLAQSPRDPKEALLELWPDALLKRLTRIFRHSLFGKFPEIVV